MTKIDLGAQFSGQVFGLLMVLCRLGAVFHLFPGLGESFVPMRVRMLFSCAVSILLYPVIAPSLPPMPTVPADLAFLIGKEILIGTFFGSVLRALMSTIETTGSIVGVQIGLSNAMIMNPSQSMQSALPAALLSYAGLALIFLTGLDHFLLNAMMDTYKIFPLNKPVDLGMLANGYSTFVAHSFKIGIQLSSPFIIAGLLLFTVLAIIQKMMANVQLFLIVLPLQILGGLFFFAATIGAILTVWIFDIDQQIGQYLIQPVIGAK